MPNQVKLSAAEQWTLSRTAWTNTGQKITQMSELTGSNQWCRAQFKCAQTVVGQRFAGNGPNGLTYYYYYYYYITSNTHRSQPIENALMDDPIKGWTEISLHDSSLLPTLQCTLQCMVHEQKSITGTHTFPISKLGGWKRTTAFHRWFKTNRHQALKHLRQYWCYGNRSVIGTRGGRWTFRNWGDIGLSPASQEITQTNKPPKHYTKTGDHNIGCCLKKKRKHTKWISATIIVHV